MITFIFGDSITLGLWDEKGGWADRVKAWVLSQEVKTNIANYHYVYNLGLDGNTTKELLERFEFEVEKRLWEGEKYAFIFATGTNDTLHYSGKNPMSTPEKYKEELGQLTKMANKYSDNIAFVNLIPVDETLTNPFAASTSGRCYTNERIDKFNKVLSTHCESYRCNHIDIHSEFTKGNYKKLLIDGLHPNTEGHELIYESVVAEVKKLLS